MEIKHWTVKDIFFDPIEREKVTKHVTRLVRSGRWVINDGDLIEGLIHGEWDETRKKECVQLITQ